MEIRVLTILLSCFSSAFVFAEKSMDSKISEEQSSMKCLSTVNGKSIPGFTGTKEMPWMDLPCMDGKISYCKRLLYEVDREVCRTKCCLLVRTTPVPMPENSEVSSTEFVTPESHIKKNNGKNYKPKGGPCQLHKNDVEITLLYVFLVIFLLACIILGICMIRDKRKIAKLERKILQPIAQPYDAETAV